VVVQIFKKQYKILSDEIIFLKCSYAIPPTHSLAILNAILCTIQVLQRISQRTIPQRVILYTFNKDEKLRVRFSSPMQITTAHLILTKTCSLQWSIKKMEQKNPMYKQ